MKGYLSLGSNLGDREKHLMDAIERLKTEGMTVTRISRIYSTPAAEVEDIQPPYLNIVITIETGLNPDEILARCQKTEKALGRERPYPKAPRTIDIDLLMIDKIEMATEDLTLPHPRLEKRSFVIYPLCDVAPDLLLPSGRSVSDALRHCGDREIEIYQPQKGGVG